MSRRDLPRLALRAQGCLAPRAAAAFARSAPQSILVYAGPFSTHSFAADQHDRHGRVAHDLLRVASHHEPSEPAAALARIAFCAFAKAMASRRPRPEVGLPSTGTRMRLYAIASLSSKKESPGHGPRRAHADEPVACVATRHLIGERGQNPSARCRPWMPDGDRASIHVDPIPVHWISGGTFPAFLPRRGVCQHLGGERFVDFDQIDVLEPQTYALSNRGTAIA